MVNKGVSGQHTLQSEAFSQQNKTKKLNTVGHYFSSQILQLHVKTLFNGNDLRVTLRTHMVRENYSSSCPLTFTSISQHTCLKTP